MLNRVFYEKTTPLHTANNQIDLIVLFDVEMYELKHIGIAIIKKRQ
jgi:hypothetical protein